ncbi:MAG: hypothetical protein UT24_C0016G0033 [Candidatus Woesebacteria bacterium GW2011_GWB1_39_12]|uniref:PD-(D/E)XK endonuclease-like domain-containing protein n=1 Tax=Candidatus Woesebacteria bacterium GW2011_GWB1_39_12 TaxID=1618574 RepID=A0A0G0M7P9_9BACT|nr:MAG: hypothetical protein UT24_C0016G0033 [Candidatus Woesebacteria bacterium GW2011_GWB1_39_12]
MRNGKRKQTNMKYDKYLFHCSMLPLLTTKSRVKGELSETCKTELTKIWIESEYGRARDVTTKFTEKGIICEQDSIDLLNKKLASSFVKNTELLKNDYITGTPDIRDTAIWDIKTSWDLLSYVQSDFDKAKKTYYYQLLGYMALVGAKSGHIAYCLVDTPDSFIRDELYRFSFQHDPESAEYKEKEQEIIKNMKFGDIPEEKRVKIFDFEFDQKAIDEVYEKVKEWRKFLNDLHL